MDLPIRQARMNLGLTQMDLAKLSEVSLPTIQNIEAGKANPSLETLRALLGVVGFELRIEPKRANWDDLAMCGAPLIGRKSRKVASSGLLVASLRSAVIELTLFTDIQERERKLEATQALLHAIRDHYPRFYKEHFSSSQLVCGLIQNKIPARLIKLKRLALARVSEVL